VVEKMVDIVAIVGTDTFWVAVGAIGAVIALFLSLMQIRASRIIASADFLIRLEANFNAPNMLIQRKQILQILKQSPKDYRRMDMCRDVFDFFEEVGLLLRKKVLPTDLVWSDYCVWTLYYWTAFSSYIEWTRKTEDDRTLYCEFEYLYEKMKKYERRRLKRQIGITPEKLADFINEEIDLLSNEIKCS
jgi:hypothetical protein